MGGTLQVPGNITPAAEFNFYADPLAAHIILSAGAEVVLFPLDVTGNAVMSPAWIQSFHALGSATGRAAAAILDAYAALDLLLHDACPVAWLLDPGLFGGEPAVLEVVWRPGHTAGYVAAWFGEQIDGRTPNATAMTTVRNDALLVLVRDAIAIMP